MKKTFEKARKAVEKLFWDTCYVEIFTEAKTDWGETLQEKGEGGIWLQPAVSDESDGYRFKVTEAAVNAQGDTLYLELQIIYLPWMPKPGIVNYFWAVDSLGNHYDCRKDFMYDDVPRVAYQGGFYSQGFESNQLEVQHFDSGAQWLELHYDRDGRDIVLRIDLTGGEEK